jgi:hypothetical protein
MLSLLSSSPNEVKTERTDEVGAASNTTPKCCIDSDEVSWASTAPWLRVTLTDGDDDGGGGDGDTDSNTDCDDDDDDDSDCDDDDDDEDDDLGSLLLLLRLRLLLLLLVAVDSVALMESWKASVACRYTCTDTAGSVAGYTRVRVVGTSVGTSATTTSKRRTAAAAVATMSLPPGALTPVVAAVETAIRWLKSCHVPKAGTGVDW